MTERHPDLSKVLIGEIGEDRKADVVFGKALRVLHETEPFEPLGNLLHCAASLRWSLRRMSRK
jgi:hypothetical protein